MRRMVFSEGALLETSIEVEVSVEVSTDGLVRPSEKALARERTLEIPPARFSEETSLGPSDTASDWWMAILTMEES